MRQHEREGLDDVRRDPQHDLALGERLADEPELVVLEVPEAAVDELGAPRRGRGSEIVLLDQEHRQAAPGGVARDPGAVDAAADNEQVEGSRVYWHGGILPDALRFPVWRPEAVPVQESR